MGYLPVKNQKLEQLLGFFSAQNAEDKILLWQVANRRKQNPLLRGRNISLETPWHLNRIL